MTTKVTALIILIISAILIAAADAFIKKSALTGSFTTALKSPWMFWSVVFYLVQIVLVTFLFLSNWKLGILANVFNVFYATSALLLGFLMFSEKLVPLQAVGVVFGLIGVFLMTR